jgi:mannose-6-phosphate isomerase
MEQHRPGVIPSGAAITRELRTWVIEQALPLWSRNGVDAARGGFQERLNRDGSPDLAAPRRLLVQARQTYVYAHASTLGWHPDSKALAVKGAEFLIERYRHPDGGYVFSLAPDNTVADPLRDTYGHMFVVLGLAWAAKVSGDAQIRRKLLELIDFIDDQLTTPDGSFIEGKPTSLPRRQNPHMHGFEAMLALHETLELPGALERAARILRLLTDHFYDETGGTIGEYFAADWSPFNGPDGDCIEPGHHAEWSWLIRKYERLRNMPPGPLPSALLQAALRGRDPATGTLVDELHRNGSIRRHTRRVWPQTELARAFIAATELGVQGAEDGAARALQSIATSYLDPKCAGGYVDRLDRHGRPLTTQMPATALYHIFGAIADAHRVWP